jgi:dienelactone hydrolase
MSDLSCRSVLCRVRFRRLALVAVAIVVGIGLVGCGVMHIPMTTIGRGNGEPTAVYGPPTGNRPPKVLLMLIHGGSWAGLNSQEMQVTEAASLIYRALPSVAVGTMTVDYRKGAQGIVDVEQFYRDARHKFPSVPICALGVSAGGNVALLLAAKFPDLACVISMAGPTDLPALKQEPHGALSGYQMAATAFGTSGLAQYSPALQASSIKAKVLLLYADNDPLVPVEQGEIMKRALPSATLIKLAPGPYPFVHTGIGAPVSISGISAGARHQSNAAQYSILQAATSQ